MYFIVSVSKNIYHLKEIIVFLSKLSIFLSFERKIIKPF